MSESGKLTRRTFLCKATAAGTTAAAMAGGLAIGRSVHAAGDDTLKIGLIGCGGRGCGAVVNALNADKNTKLVAMADVFGDRLQGGLDAIKKQVGQQAAVDPDRCFVGFDAYQKLIQSGVEVVLIAAPAHFHPIHLKACVEAGKHVFVEKPHAIDAPGVRTVLAASEEAKKKNLSIVSGLCWRYHTGVRETMKRVLDGAIGEILSIRETYMHPPFRHYLQNRRPDWTEMEHQMRNWYHFNWLSGDDICQAMIHGLDKAAWAMRDQPPVRAWGMGGREVCTGPEYGDLFDHHAVVYEYANGASVYAYCRAQNGCYNDVSDEIIGTKGRCNLLKCRIKGANPWRYKDPECNMYDVEHQELFASIRNGKPINNGLYMARSTMLAVLGRMVEYTGQTITWDEAIQSRAVLAPERYAWDARPPAMPDGTGRYPTPIPGVTKFA
jgi:predicted dehydrogenase